MAMMLVKEDWYKKAFCLCSASFIVRHTSEVPSSALQLVLSLSHGIIVGLPIMMWVPK